MSAPRDPFDLRRAVEDVVLDALRAGHPLALAEAYHRTVPAGHAVARRLMSGAEDVEDLLLAVYTRLWTDAPAAGPLEGWVRRTTWSIGVERLRATGTAPASPSAAGLVPDLPAPDVRFLDAAERAIAELPDEQRRALLLAHDKGVSTAGQEDGAAQSLTRALLALAGPETSPADREAMDADGCPDLSGMGDWCLGVASSREQVEVETAIDERPGCAATSRAVRRGRRRIEGLPATPDMGQRILVSVITASGAPAAQPDEPEVVAIVPPPAEEDAPLPVEEPPADGGADAGAEAESGAELGEPMALDPTGPLAPVTGETTPAMAAGPEADQGDGDLDPFAPPDDGFGAPDDPFAEAEPTADDYAFAAHAGEDPFARSDEPTPVGPADPVGDTADLDRVEDVDADEGAGAEQDWRPDPGSTAELRLSDILAEGEDDDPFAGLDDEGDDEGDDRAGGSPPPTRAGDPYAALRDLEGGGAAQTPSGGITAARHPAEDPDTELVGCYEEGQELQELTGPPSSGRLAAVLAWILPILGGSALGVLIAVLVFGPPS